MYRLILLKEVEVDKVYIFCFNMYRRELHFYCLDLLVSGTGFINLTILGIDYMLNSFVSFHICKYCEHILAYQFLFS